MESRLINKGSKMVLEIQLDSTGLDRAAVARAMLAAHGLRDGQAAVEFVSPSTSEY